MPIRFHCKGCKQLLGIASRKADAEIKCPKCGLAQRVPHEEAATAMSQSVQAPEGGDQPFVADIDGDEPTAVEPMGAAHSRQTPPAGPTPGRAAPPLPDDGQPVPQGMILYQRRTLYLQGVLILLFVSLAFAAGYLIGRGDASLELQAAHQAATRQTVLLDGRLYYETGGGEVAADAGAVVIVLPAERSPERTLSIQGLRPRDPVPDQREASVRAIEDLGGVYQQADESGAFTTVLPEEGRYRVLLVSGQTTRPKDTDIDELDLSEIRKYFHRAADLIGRYKYDWSLENIESGGGPIEHSFGRSGQE